MRADRLLSVLLLLQAHGRQTARELASRLEVSERTIHRDMDALSAAGVPVVAVRGPNGGWELDENWRTEVPGLDEAELRALLLAQPRIVGDARLASAAERAIDKLLAALPAALRARAATMRQRLYVDTTGWFGRGEQLDALPLVQEALSRDRKLRIEYCKKSGERSCRVIDPLGLVAKGPAWYLVANTEKGYRTFRVSRIERVEMLEDACKRPADFDLGQYWRLSTAAFVESRRFGVRLHAEPGAAEILARWCRSAPVGQMSGDRRVTVDVEFDDEEQAMFVVLGFGSRVEVLEPLSLRERVREEVVRAASRHELIGA